MFLDIKSVDPQYENPRSQLKPNLISTKNYLLPKCKVWCSDSFALILLQENDSMMNLDCLSKSYLVHTQELMCGSSLKHSINIGHQKLKFASQFCKQTPNYIFPYMEIKNVLNTKHVAWAQSYKYIQLKILPKKKLSFLNTSISNPLLFLFLSYLFVSIDMLLLIFSQCTIFWIIFPYQLNPISFHTG